ncbi:pectate lyase family protein [Symbioplanes lichenis]|uniref:pectate lyase family protein n=1 Tax=Symbioplanes lichenis TaxID=1629072 RepID=UPI0027382042|nr:right-handed parallel beta-helix repeat-containing protein [Actinoplanes lichenis]
MRGILPVPILVAAMLAAPRPAAPAPDDFAQAASSSPDGFASVAALGLGGTTGGAGGATVTVDTTDELLTAIDTVGPLIIQVSGTIAITSKQGVRPDKSIIGLGVNAVVTGGGFDFYRSSNVIVRNVTFTDAEDDALNIGQESHHIWIDHNTFVRPVDGSVDIVRGADYVTVSWNHFAGTDKSMLIGHSDGAASTDIGHLKVSIHHNWFDGSRQRHPRVRFGEPVHVYNNWFRGNELYGVASTMNAGVLVEGNNFSGVPYPCFSVGGYADSAPGRLVQRGNVFGSSGPCEAGGTVVEPSTWYAYTLDAPAAVPALVQSGAGAGKL